MARDVTIFSSNSQSTWLLLQVTFLPILTCSFSCHPTRRTRDSDCLRDGWSGDQIPVEARFSAPVHTGTGAQPSSYTLGTGSFTRVKRPGRGVAHPHLEPRLKKERVIGRNVPLSKASFHTFRFATGRQFPIIAGHGGGTQGSPRLFTQSGRFAGREFTGRLPSSSTGRGPVAESTVMQMLLTDAFTHSGYFPAVSGDHLPLQCQ